MLELTVDYVGERAQFGVPVGSFQAIKHHLADAALGLEFAEPLVAVAAHRLRLGEPAGVASSMAKLRASRAAHEAGRVALQCHGAIGYTVECDLHLYLKRSWALHRQHGGEAWHLARVRSELLGG
jgi:alkylation response protein AidB-like acyl-CoA dehydrogenase